MGLHDRPYMKTGGGGWQDSGGGGRVGGGLTLGMPRPTPAVKVLLIINVVAYVAQMFLDRSGMVSRTLGVTLGGFWQLWRYVTFQFLHGGTWHILLNMLGVYFLGTPMEKRWGTRRFVVFYLACGAVAGVAYVIIGALFDLPPDMPIIGASGGVYALVLGCAVFFPEIRLIFLFFPVPIRLAALIIFGGMILTVLQAVTSGMVDAAMSDVAHLGGAVGAAFYIWVLPYVRDARQRTSARLNQGAWQRRMDHAATEQKEIDRILAKIHDEGLNSLSSREKRILRDATRKQQRDGR